MSRRKVMKEPRASDMDLEGLLAATSAILAANDLAPEDLAKIAAAATWVRAALAFIKRFDDGVSAREFYEKRARADARQGLRRVSPARQGTTHRDRADRNRPANRQVVGRMSGWDGDDGTRKERASRAARGGKR